MGKKWIILIVLAMIIAGGYYLYSQGEIGKPSAEVDSVKINEVTISSTKLDIRITVRNPNPLGINVDKVDYDVYFLQNGNSKFLGEGVRKKNVHVRADGDTSFTVPFETNNSDAIRMLAEFLRNKGEIKIKVNGSILIDLKITSIKVPFSETKTVSV